MIKQSLMLAAATLALAACNKPAADTATDTTAAASNAVEVTGSAIGNAASGLEPASPMTTPTAAGFVRDAAISDMYEIASSKLALTMSKSTAITKYAGEMIAEHTATSAKVKAITAGDAGLKPPAAMDDKHLKLIADLKAAGPDKFDTLYVDQQTAAHQDAVALMTDYGAKGDNAALKAFAVETAPKVQHHLDMVKQIDHSGVPDSKAGNAS